MDKTELKSILEYVSADLDRVVKFWLDNSHDDLYGGFFNCLDINGQIYDETKYIWLLARQVWMYSRLHNQVERLKSNETLLKAAINGANFLMSDGIRDPVTYKCCFSCTKDGKPLKIQRTIFSECFYFMALSELFIATKDEKYKTESIKMYQKIQYWVFQDDTELGRPKLSGAKSSSALAIPMMMLFLLDQYLTMDATPDWFDSRKTLDWCIENIMKHLQRNKTVVLENVSPDGKEIGGFAGRLINPGHAIEGGWVLITIANRFGKDYDWLKNIAIENFIVSSFNRGWDTEFGGLFYFLDADNYSPIQLEWNMKLWWPHNEALIAFLVAYIETKEIKHWETFKKIFEYSKKHFIDEKNGEWYGYLNRDGTTSMRFKGGPYKGCFHVPRCLMMIEDVLTKMLNDV